MASALRPETTSTPLDVSPAAVATARSVADEFEAEIDREEALDETNEIAAKEHIFTPGRIIIALVVAVIAVFAIVYFTNTGLTTLESQISMAETSFTSTTPTYTPRDFAFDSITTENGKLIMSFSSDSGSYQITEEASSWDSATLLSNYVKSTWGDSYQVIKENGLVIYVCGSNATWVNGGILYKITSTGNSLTKKQIRSIAISFQ